MKRILLAAAALIIVAFPAGVLVAACSSSDPPPSGTSGGVVPPSPTTTPDATAGDANADADGAPVQTPACNALVPGGAAVAATALAGSAPAAVGGTIAAGKYNLTKRDYYAVVAEGDGGVPGQASMIQRVLVFDAYTVSLAESVGPAGAGAVTKLTNKSTYKIFDTVLAMTAFCPPPDVNTNTAFSVVGNELWLFPNEGEREVYTRE